MYQFRSASVVNESFYCLTSSTKYNNLCLCSGIMMTQCSEIAHLICSWSWIFVVFQLLSCVQCLQRLGLQHPQASLFYTIYQSLSNSCPLSQWCHPAISSSVIFFSSHLQSFSASGSFPMTQFFPSGDQSIGASTSASVLPMSIQGWFPLGLTDLISLQSKGLSRVFSNTTVQKHQFFGAQPSSQSNFISIHDHRKNHSLD